MRSASTDFEAALAHSTTTLARLYRLKANNRAQLYITDHDAPIIFGGHTYVSGQDGITGTAIDNTVGAANTNFDISVLLGSLISRSDIERGIYRYAAVEIDAVFWDHPEYGIAPLVRGQVQDATTSDKYLATLSCTGLAINASRLLTENYSPTCRAEFCDHRCSLSIATFTSTTKTVATVTGTLTFSAASINTTVDYYKLGHVTWVTGANAGRVSDVIGSGGGSIKLLTRTPFQIEDGDTFTVSRGCDKTVASCTAFGNLLNMRGEPYVPGSDFVVSPIQATPPVEAATPPTPLPDDWDWRLLSGPVI